MKSYSAIAATIAAITESPMFGVMGDGNMFLIDAFVHDCHGRYVAAATEAGAVLMATGFARGSGNVGLATVTHGPGLTNAFTPLMAAARQRLPLVLVAGDTARAQWWNAQNIDHRTVVGATGAGFEEPATPDDGPAVLLRAFRRASIERRPIVVNHPVDFEFIEINSTDTPITGSYPVPVPLQPTESDMNAAVGAMATAKRPIVLAGAGVAHLDAVAAVTALADSLGAPLATTLPAKGIFRGSPADIGVFGTLSSELALETIQAADCIVALGASLNPYTGGGAAWPLLSGKAVVHCDIDPLAFGTGFRTDLGVHADAEAFARTAVEWLSMAEIEPTGFRSSITQAVEPAFHPTAPGTVDLNRAIIQLNELLPDDRAVVMDGGRFAFEVIKRFDARGLGRWACSIEGLGVVGSGLPTALGLALAQDDVPTIAIVGDGGFMLGGLAEFHTAVREGLDIIVVVLNDGSYGAEHGKLKARAFRTATSLFDWPDFAPVAESLGAIGLTIKDEADFQALPDLIGRRDRAVLIDVKIDPDAAPHRY